MSRVKSIEPATASGRAKELLDSVQKSFGMTPNLMRIMANQPAVLDAYLKFSNALEQGSLDAKTREGIALTSAGANACGYCASAHTAISKMLNVEPVEIEAQLAGRSSDKKLAAALAFTRTLIAKRGDVSNADITALRAAGHDDGAIIEIVANVVANILTNYLSHVSQTEIDFPVVDPTPHRIV
ncbi:MAG TPA: carboxymuconolactone decarboxylase family protein [Alphaproteobacteria bacterium]|nr:carboxymuconolactone decarboxylase family protein [Alphaproteobacteria bacterium]